MYTNPRKVGKPYIRPRFPFPFITDPARLQKYINDDAVFVAMDIEGAPDISELAISVLPPSALRRLASGEKPPSDVNYLA